MFDDIRSHFPIFEHKAYINSCSYGALSLEVAASYQAYLDSRFSKGADWEEFVGKNEAVRDLCAQLIHAEPDEIAVTTSASAGLNAVISAMQPTSTRNKVVLSDFEFPTVGQIWLAQEGRGYDVVHARQQGATIPFSEYERLIDDRTQIVSIAHICYRNGAMNEVERIIRLAHDRGAMVILDSSQAAGAIPIDVRALNVDILISGVLKYLLSSAGVGFLYVRKDHLKTLNPYATGWFAQEDVHAMDMHHHIPAHNARRFESGTPPIPALYAAQAGLQMILEAGVGNIQSHVRELTSRFIDEVKAMGGTLMTPESPDRHGAMIAVKSTDDHKLVAALAERNVITSCRDGNLRVSPHFYNSHADFDALMSALKDNRSLLA
ncbi:putative aminotransferase YcbU [Iodidimonas muriae]|uniref:Aminotransferase YcbU n=1 Tax=Iodidimonas muriae TaxID=261467 RepID=A0ABQ2LFW3_9PROT|nr:aminotransferase class V-fold PLP-dependent enzyme [Iodidimonas muriae]GER07675.1 putative aminotransferase YcbU [Kordiimonadales bacterium JCM 17843]GGO14643.1 putative aminotransferase YcbU [Iodidimonas muriae]